MSLGNNSLHSAWLFTCPGRGEGCSGWGQNRYSPGSWGLACPRTSPGTREARVCSPVLPVGLDRCERLQRSGAAGVKERIQLPPAVPDLSQQSSVEIKSQHKLV